MIAELIKAYQEGEKRASEQLAEHFTPLVKFLAGQIHQQYPFTEYDDLVQEGYIGLLSGLSKYEADKDPSEGKKLYVYLSQWIKGRMMKLTHYENVSVISVETSYGGDRETGFYLADDENIEERAEEEDGVDTIDQQIRREELDRLLADFDIREKIAFKLRFGIDSEPRTLQQVSEVINMSYETVRNMETRILQKLNVTKVNIKKV